MESAAYCGINNRCISNHNAGWSLVINSIIPRLVNFKTSNHGAILKTVFFKDMHAMQTTVCFIFCIIDTRFSILTVCRVELKVKLPRGN